LELAVGQRQHGAAANRPSLDDIQFQVVGPQDGFAAAPIAPQQDAQPGQQFGQGEGFNQVVVGTGVQSFDPVVNAILGSQDEDGHGLAGAAHLAENLQAALTRQQQIEHDAIK